MIIANFIFEFLAIHPFKDGNGRISRALTNLLFLQVGYSYTPYVSLDEIIEQTKAEYYLALRATQKNHKTKHEDITWVEYLLSSLLEQSEKARRTDGIRAARKTSEKQTQIYQLFEKNDEANLACPKLTNS